MERLAGFEVLALSNREEEIQQVLSRKDLNENVDTKLLQQEASILSAMSEAYSNERYTEARALFYQSKCGFDLDRLEDFTDLQHLLFKYTEGFQFVLLYYYEGVPSWNWYYPAYYAPLCSDLHLYLHHLKNNYQGQFQMDFIRGQPYEPFKQLLSILSPINALLLPHQYRHLLTSRESPLRSPLDYYPADFEIDPYGAIWEHQHITKIPFIDESFIDAVFKSIDIASIEPEVRARNMRGQSTLFTYNSTIIT